MLITILVSVRKLMLQEIAHFDFQTLLAFAGLLMALGGLYWLISDGDRRHAIAASKGSPEAGMQGAQR